MQITTENNKISYHNDADGKQMYITVSLGNHDLSQALGQCTEEINKWMCQNFLRLNQDKTEVVVFGTRERALKVNTEL